MGPETTTSYGDGQRRGGVKWHRGANRAPRCVIHNDCQLQLPIARAASQLYSSAITAIGAALATAGLTLAGVSAAGSTAVSAIADGATTVVEADRCSRQRNGSNRRPKKKTFHHRVSISRESESKDAMPQHTAQANNPSPSTHDGTEMVGVFSSATHRKRCGEADMEWSGLPRAQRDSTRQTTATNLRPLIHDTPRQTVGDHVRSVLQQWQQNHAESAAGNDTAGLGLLHNAAGRTADTASTHLAHPTGCSRNMTFLSEPSSMAFRRRTRQTQKPAGR